MKNSMQTACKICEICGPDALKEHVIRKFERFCVGNFSIKDAERSSCSRTVNTKSQL